MQILDHFKPKQIQSVKIYKTMSCFPPVQAELLCCFCFCRFSKHGSLKSHEELELPPELTEDWATMEVCVDCKKFISDIIASSKHSLSLATKRARLKRKTQSFYMSSPKGREEYHPSERTISEIWTSVTLLLAASSSNGTTLDMILLY